MWVADELNNRVQEFSGSGTFIRKSRCSSPTTLPPTRRETFGLLPAVAAGPTEYSNTGALIQEVGDYGSGDGQFSNGSEGVTFDAAGNLWATDLFGYRVMEFSPNPVPEPSTLTLLALGLGCADVAASLTGVDDRQDGRLE